MSRSTLFFIFFLAFVTVLLGYNYFVQPFKLLLNLEPQNQEEVLTKTQSREDLLLEKLSTREKIWQLMAVPYTVSASASAEIESIVNVRPGFITLFGEQISTTSAKLVSSNLSTKLKMTEVSGQNIPIWLAVDHEGGTVQRLNGAGFTRLPSWQELCQLEPEKRAIILDKTARELSAAGIKVVFAPMVDLASPSGALRNRVCGSDPKVVLAASQQFIELFARYNMVSVLKHFPGIGSAKKDLHLQFDRVTVSADDVLVYRTLLEQFPGLGVMVAHVGVTNQYPDIPCSLSDACVGELKNNFPQALVFTDALDMKAAQYTVNGSQKSLENISLEALQAGNNVLVYGKGVDISKLEVVVDSLEARAATDSALFTQIDYSIRQIIHYKLLDEYAEPK